MKIQKFLNFNLNENITNSTALEIIDEIEQLTNYSDDNTEDTLRTNIQKINELISDLRFQCE